VGGIAESAGAAFRGGDAFLWAGRAAFCFGDEIWAVGGDGRGAVGGGGGGLGR